MGAASSSEVVAEKLREMGEGTYSAFYSKLGPLLRTGRLYTPTRNMRSKEFAPFAGVFALRPKTYQDVPKSIPKTPETPQIAAPRAQWVTPNDAHAPRAQ